MPTFIVYNEHENDAGHFQRDYADVVAETFENALRDIEARWEFAFSGQRILVCEMWPENFASDSFEGLPRTIREATAIRQAAPWKLIASEDES